MPPDLVGTIGAMDVTTELLDNAAFREAKRGYNTQDVDEFIEQVKTGVLKAEAEVVELRQQLETTDARIAAAEQRAAEAAEQARGASEADETLKRTLVLAQRTADAAIKEAEEQAARTLSSAQDQSARMLADAQEATARARADAEHEARRAQEEARARVLDELQDLESARDNLLIDVDGLERHLEEQRERVRTTARELQRLLDDPASLRTTVAPAVATAAPPTTVDLTAPVGDDPPTDDHGNADGWAPEPAEAPADVATDAPTDESDAGQEPDDDGPPTESIDMLAEREAGDDAYLAELRKAMTDESPLGPRDDDDPASLFETSTPEPSRSRFGRRR
jgi:DivIVA domain-containing protein